MAKVTQNVLNAQASRLRRAMAAAGMIEPTTALALERGSKVNGLAWRLWTVSPPNVRETQPFGWLHFGFTSAECYHTLDALTTAIEGANKAWKDKTVNMMIRLSETPSAQTGNSSLTGVSTSQQESPPATSAG